MSGSVNLRSTNDECVFRARHSYVFLYCLRMPSLLCFVLTDTHIHTQDSASSCPVGLSARCAPASAQTAGCSHLTYALSTSQDRWGSDLANASFAASYPGSVFTFVKLFLVFQGVPEASNCRWLFTSAYTLNTEGLLPFIIEHGRQVCYLCCDLLTLTTAYLFASLCEASNMATHVTTHLPCTTRAERTADCLGSGVF